MTDAENPRQDRWADWLVRGRRLGYSDREVAAMQRHLNRIRDRLIKAAKLRAGERVLDVGAGTGLVALEARHRVKGSGRVVACDISHDALVHCRDAVGAQPDLGALFPVLGDLARLPFPDHYFDSVFTRSVLIYLEDKAKGVRELFRVLRPGGRAAVFEPINDVWRVTMDRLRALGTYDAFRPPIDRIFEHYATSESSRFLGWDERDLVGWFEEAGFSDVKLDYEYTSQRPGPPKRITKAARARFAAMSASRPNPYDPSFEELVRRFTGEDADTFLERWTEFQLGDPPPRASAVAYVTARR